MKVLVSGHKGYIGSVMVPMLQANGHTVKGLDTNYYEDCIFIKKPKLIPEIRKDFRDIQKGDVEGYDAIIHLGALSNDPLGEINPKITYDINYESSIRFAEIAKTTGVKKFLFSSSCSVYGTSGGRVVDETSNPNPLTAYAKSKVLTEKEISKVAGSSFSPTFLRSATAYGVSPKLRSDLVVNNLVGWAYLTGKIVLKSDGQAWRPLVHIKDISKAFIAVLHAETSAVNNQIFNVGQTAENYRVIDIAKTVNQIIPNSTIEFTEGAEPDKRSYRVDFSKIQTSLPAFKPTWTIKKGVEELYKAFFEYGISMESLEGPMFQRVKHLRRLMEKGLVDSTLKWRK